jgi:hypothetical protein
VATAAPRTSQLVRGLPFDTARETYAKVIRVGLIKDSMLAQAKFARSLGALEKLTLGPWARRV